MTRTQILQYLQIFVLLLALLYFGRALFVPLSFALLISFVSYPVCRWLEARRWPRSLAIAVCLLGLVLFVAAFGAILVAGVAEISQEWPVIFRQLTEAFSQLTSYLDARFDLTPEQQSRYLRQAGSNVLSTAGGMLQSLLSFSATSAAILFIIPVFVALILANRELLTAALMAALPADRRPVARQVLHESVTTYYEFVKGMAIVYAIVGALNSVGLLVLGIPNPLFFGILASLLTFIPYVGIFIGGSVPVAIAWADSPAKALAVIAVFGLVQYLEANLIFPRAVGQRLKINTFAMLIAIIVGGLLWGGAGLVLLPPMIGILRIIADKLENWRPLALLLGTDE
ncbi:AI-2E family transporter [Tellurirhabdus rosea]|uniref:AI-2E family transporter n=1 Tax=Tellurirhabdus rosea TaxID=2674997 RepID=UPI0022593C4B|nr:AI-2E family transporter [Tellurirhabdus rosea]